MVVPSRRDLSFINELNNKNKTLRQTVSIVKPFVNVRLKYLYFIELIKVLLQRL